MAHPVCSSNSSSIGEENWISLIWGKYKKTKKNITFYNIILSQTSQTTRHRSGHESGYIAYGSAAGSMYGGQELNGWGQKTPTRARSPDRGMSRRRGHF